MSDESRVRWVWDDQELAQRLDLLWAGETWRDDDDSGLAATLDGLPDWHGWESWGVSQQVEQLRRLVTEWEQSGEGTDAVEPEPSSEDAGAPRWNPDTGAWELFNVEAGEWWAYDGDSGTWFDAAAQQWVPLQVSSAAPFDWVTEDQVTTLVTTYGGDWHDALTQVLETRWGTSWQDHPAEHKHAWLGDLLPELSAPSSAAPTAEAVTPATATDESVPAMVVPAVDFDEDFDGFDDDLGFEADADDHDDRDTDDNSAYGDVRAQTHTG